MNSKFKDRLFLFFNVCKTLHPVVTYTLTIYVLKYPHDFNSSLFFVIALVFFRFLIGCLTKYYKLSYRYASIEEIVIISATITAGSILTYTLSLFSNYTFYESVLIIEILLSIFAVSFVHIASRLYIIVRYHLVNEHDNKDLLIVGSGMKASLFVREIKNSSTKENEYKIIGAVKKDEESGIRNIHGIPVLGPLNNLEDTLKTYNIDAVVVAFDDSTVKDLDFINSVCQKNNVAVKILPDSISDRPAVSISDLRDISLVDLLDRKEITIDIKKVSEFINNKVVLITGAAGSIGSELCRQVASFGPKKLILVDHAETPLYDIDLELSEKFHSPKHKPYVADIRDAQRMESVFQREKIQIIFHAAAYKHVPLMESNIIEAISTNVKGTKICSELAVKFGVKKFIFVSTDKAVNPTNIMGCSKRIAELYIQSLSYENSTETSFITTRFGNVLGSNGSVIPRFKKQIKAGGPITVTHPEITRYFMLITEAVSLVLQAGMMGKGREIFLFDMGKSVKIKDLAEKIVRLSGLEPYDDIQIEYTGLRPGEKIYEEMLIKGENNVQTDHKRIVCANSIKSNHSVVNSKVENLLALKNTIPSAKLVDLLKDIVEEYEPKSH